ncbi:MAG: NUDIX domain-containing protein [Bacteroidetes bacterium]|nr:NUDIX domain-containing protein [Bacteroidota bacterium]
MQQNYKIFVNECTLLFANTNQVIHNSFKIVSHNDLDSIIQPILNNTYKGARNIAYQSSDYCEVFKQIKKPFNLIKAAGGIVYNDKKQLLLIKRLGKWDLPKGKIEKGEDQRLAALREVHEECGIAFLGIVKKSAYTYHVYFLKGRWILKRTVWFTMIAFGTDKLVPQTEENITEVKWVDIDFVKQPNFDTYASLIDIFEKL